MRSPSPRSTTGGWALAGDPAALEDGGVLRRPAGGAGDGAGSAGRPGLRAGEAAGDTGTVTGEQQIVIPFQQEAPVAHEHPLEDEQTTPPPPTDVPPVPGPLPGAEDEDDSPVSTAVMDPG
jgi:hypothetical protein